MASVDYGPEAIVLVLAAAGAHGLGFTLPVTPAIAGLAGGAGRLPSGAAEAAGP
ncbi:hypothetical protein ACFZC7_33795 [Streptomyces massasporeus]|uniref:hypothetical protein n=1 Tax=Streptomyces massasporeus TaxID=67324 RepID=UPI0036E323F5